MTNDYQLRAAVQRVLGPDLQCAAIAEQDQAAVSLHAAVMTCEVISDYARLHDSQLLQRVRCHNCCRAASVTLGGFWWRQGWLVGQAKLRSIGPILRNRYANCDAKRPCYHGFPESHTWVLNIIGFGASQLASAPYGKSKWPSTSALCHLPQAHGIELLFNNEWTTHVQTEPELGCC